MKIRVRNIECLFVPRRHLLHKETVRISDVQVILKLLEAEP
jgi:hypothetical protein